MRDRPLGQMQRPRDLRVGLARGDVHEHLLLAAGQPRDVGQCRALRPAWGAAAALGSSARERPRGGARAEPV